MILPNFRFRCVSPGFTRSGRPGRRGRTFALRPTALPKPTAEHAVCIPSLFYPLIRLQENDL